MAQCNATGGDLMRRSDMFGFDVEEKNTFLHVNIFNDEGLTAMRRQNSAPASTSSCSRETSTDSRFSESLEQLDRLLEPSEARRHSTDCTGARSQEISCSAAASSEARRSSCPASAAGAEQCDSSDEEGEEPQEEAAAGAKSERRRRRELRQSNRPCKSKRLRLKTLVDKLEAQVREDPDNFVLDEASLPPCAHATPKFVPKLKERLAALSEQLRSETGGAAPSSPQQPAPGPSLQPAPGQLKMSL